MKRIAIVGGGISGLSAAYYLSKAGHDCTLIEASPRLGGVIRTEHVEGCVVEAGPDSFLAQKPWALELIRELGLEDQVIGSQDHLRRTYVLRQGQAHPAARRHPVSDSHPVCSHPDHAAAEPAGQSAHGAGVVPAARAGRRTARSPSS